MGMDAVSTAPIAVGMEGMEKLPVASRVNFGAFRGVAVGTAVRVGGRLAGATLTTTDGGAVNILPGASLGESLSSLTSGSFVEVVGTKEGDASLRAEGGMSLGADVDVELWDEAVKMTQLPQLRTMFEPAAAIAA